MKFRTLGRTCINVSEISFGAWAIGESAWGKQDDAESIKALHRACELGCNFIDTAAAYGNGKSEKIIAQFRKEYKGALTLATKSPVAAGSWPPSPYDAAEKSYPAAFLRGNVEQRLRNLEVDCLDLLQLHTWTRAWNKNPTPLYTLQELKKAGKIKHIGVSTPEHDQNSVVDLIRSGLVDTVQVIYNIFEQEPSAEILPLALEKGVGIIVRVAFDEGALTGKFNYNTAFPEGDFRAEYFRGERLNRTVDRVEKIKTDLKDSNFSMPQLALKFSLAHPAVSTVISGIRSVDQANQNLAVSDLPDLSESEIKKLQKNFWNRGNWHSGNW